MSDEEILEIQNLESVGSHENPPEVNLEEGGKENNFGYMSYGHLKGLDPSEGFIDNEDNKSGDDEQIEQKENNSGYMSYGHLKGLDPSEGFIDNEDNESGDDEQIESESKTPTASFIVLESVSASLSGDLEKSPNCGTRDDVFQDNHLELGIQRDGADDFSPISYISTQSERATPKKPEMPLEEFQKTTATNIIDHHGKQIEDRIERFETLHQQPEFSEQIRAKDTFVVSKGHANEIKEKLEKGKLGQEVEKNHDNSGSVPPPQLNRKKLADDWLTKVKLLTQTTEEAKVQTGVISSGIRDIWKKRETGGNLNEMTYSENARPIPKVGKLRPDYKEAVFGRSADKAEILEKDSNDCITTEASRKVKRTPSYSSCQRNSTHSTQNFVTYTKTGVKTDVKINLTNYPGCQTRGDSYRSLDRCAMIKMLDDLKARVAQLEDENRNLKMALSEFEIDYNQEVAKQIETHN